MKAAFPFSSMPVVSMRPSAGMELPSAATISSAANRPKVIDSVHLPMGGGQPLSDGLHHIDGDAVSGLLIQLGV